MEQTLEFIKGKSALLICLAILKPGAENPYLHQNSLGSQWGYQHESVFAEPNISLLECMNGGEGERVRHNDGPMQIDLLLTLVGLLL